MAEKDLDPLDVSRFEELVLGPIARGEVRPVVAAGGGLRPKARGVNLTTGEVELSRLGSEEERALECATGSTLLALYFSVAAPVAEHYAGAGADFLVYLLWAAWAITLSNWVAVRRIQGRIVRACGGGGTEDA